MIRSDITAVVLAGGFGTRIRHLLQEVPKPMAEVAGRPFLEHVVRYLASFGFNRIILSTGYRSEMVEAHFSTARFTGIEITCAREPEPRGTAGGFLEAARSASMPPSSWLVLNGDSLIFADLRKFAEAFDRYHCEAALIGLQVDDTTRFGSIRYEPDGQLRGFSEKQPGAGTINAGVYLFQNQALAKFPNRIPLSFEVDVFPALLQRGIKIHVHQVQVPFLDIGTPESLPAAAAFIRANMPISLQV